MLRVQGVSHCELRVVLDFHFFVFHHQRVVIQRVLPQLCSEFSNHQMVPFALPNVLLIAEDCTSQEYVDLILPELKPVFKIQEPVQVRSFLSSADKHVTFLNHFSVLFSKRG